MPYRVHVRRAPHLRRSLTPRVASAAFLFVTLLASPAFAQAPAEAPEPTAAPEAADDDESAATPEAVEADAAGDVSADAAEDTGEIPTAPEAKGGVPAGFDPEAPEGRPVFLVTDIIVEDGVGISSEGARDALAARFGRMRDKIDVRSLSEVKATLDQQGLNQLLGGEGDGLQKLGDYVDADRVVFGRIHKVGGVTEVAVRVFNVREGVMEMAMSRRLKAGANDALVLSIVDALADRLTVWALNTYGDAAPSSKFAEMQGKKVNKGGGAGASAGDSPWSFLGVGGGALAGVGLGAVAVGATIVSADPLHDALMPSIVIGAGAATFLGGMTLVVLDGME